MKRILYTFGFMLAAGALIAQPSMLQQELKHEQRFQQVFESEMNTLRKSSRDLEVIYADDFDDPGLWIIDNDGTPPTDWIITDQGPVGFFSAGMGAINSTSGGNFALFDSDAIGTSENDIQDAWIQMAEPLDLSDYQFVNIQFESYYRRFRGNCYVEFSTDGNNWNQIQIHTGIAINAATDNPELVNLNVADLIGGASTAWVRFRYIGEWDYAWMVDDLRITVTPPNDLVLTDAYRGFWPVAFDDAVDAIPGDVTLAAFAEAVDDLAMVKGYEYGFIPGDQGNMHVVGYILNNGLDTQTGVVLTATVTDPEGVEHIFESPDAATIEPLEAVRIDFEVDLAAEFGGTLPQGLFTVTYSAFGDQEEENPSDNFATGKVFRVNPGTTIAHDTGLNVASSYYIQPHNAIWANRIAFQEPATITHVSFAVAPNRNLYPDTAQALANMDGELIFPNIRRSSVMKAASDNNPASAIYGQTELEYVIEEEAVTLTGNNAIMINFPLPEPVEVDLNRVYHAEMFIPPVAGGAEPWIWVPTRPDANRFATMLRDLTANSSYGQGWFELGANVLLRFVVEGTLSTSPMIHQLDFSMGQNYPNPVTNHTTIEWALEKPMQNIRFSVTDNTGRTVYEKDLGDRPAGVQEPIMIDMGRFAAGVYQYGITIGQNRIVRKMMIAK
jgi:hypothetical protein